MYKDLKRSQVFHNDKGSEEIGSKINCFHHSTFAFPLNLTKQYNIKHPSSWIYSNDNDPNFFNE